jgi:hypothetical protein
LIHFHDVSTVVQMHRNKVKWWLIAGVGEVSGCPVGSEFQFYKIKTDWSWSPRCEYT